MKEKLLELIYQTDEIEKEFHTIRIERAVFIPFNIHGFHREIFRQRVCRIHQARGPFVRGRGCCRGTG